MIRAERIVEAEEGKMGGRRGGAGQIGFGKRVKDLFMFVMRHLFVPLTELLPLHLPLFFMYSNTSVL